MEAKRATLRDVAAAAGVSRALAGFVLGDDHGKSIPEATRERVREAARSLGYAPHGIARALREGSSRVVVLSIDPSLESNYSRTFARGLDDELAAHGHVLLVRHEHPAPVPERRILDTISPRAVLRLPGNYLAAGHELDDGGWEGGIAANVLLQVRYLADRGHARIVVALPDGDPPLGPVRVRFAREAAVRAGIAEPPALVVPRSRPAAVEAVREFRAAHGAVTAVAAYDDDVALRVLAAMRVLGLAAPGDLAVIGFDDTEYGALVDPALTTVHVDAEEHGRKAAREVLGLDPGTLGRFTPGRVIVRAGVAARQRQAYEAMLNDDAGPFITGVPVLFSPAGAAQDEANPKGGYGRFAQILLPLEYGSWAQEAQAHVRSAYLGDWTSLSKVLLRGRQALEFLSRAGLNDLSRFATGQVRHHVQLDGNGWVASEGVLVRLGEEEFSYTAGSCDWLAWQFSQGGWDAELTDISPERFIFGVQGPQSLVILEKATGESPRDIGFNRSRASSVSGIPVRVLRTGISGELGYELHGPADEAGQVWRAVAEAGAESGIQLLGFRSQPVQHIEAGIATNGLDYLPAAAITPGAPRQFKRGPIGGSFVPAGGFTDYFRKPGELGWGPRTLPGHDFLGRDALAADAASGGPARILAGLTWNAADVAAVLTSMLGDGELPDQMDMPRLAGPSFDQVLVGGAPAGVSTGRTVSPTLRAMISLCVIDRAHAQPGTEATVIWGRPGTPQREIRATVTRLPFKPDRRRVDVTTL